MYKYFLFPLPPGFAHASTCFVTQRFPGIAHAASADVTVAAAVGGGKRTAANVVFAALGWWSTIPSLPDASWLSVTGLICVAEMRRFDEGSCGIFTP